MPDFKKLPTVNRAAVALAAGLLPLSGSSDLMFWVDASQIAGLNDGDAVAVWPDLSGHNYDLAQPSGGNQPTWQTGEINGRPVVRFDGTNDRMFTPLFSAPLAQPTTLFLLCKLNTTSGAQILLEGVNCTDRQVIRTDSGVWKLGPGGISGGATDTVAHVLTVEFGATDTLRVDGRESVSGDAGSGAMGGVRLSGWCDESGDFINADIAEMLVYDRALTAVERQQVEGYLADKYNLAGGPASFAATTRWGTD